MPESNNTIAWTQSDYLKIANALSQVVWHGPLDLKEWNVHDVIFEKGCEDDPSGMFDK